MSVCTMNRFAAMHDWPLFCPRAVTAVLTASSRSTDGITMNGSLPPSSITVGLISSPQMAATDWPAGSLPVSVAAAGRGWGAEGNRRGWGVLGGGGGAPAFPSRGPGGGTPPPLPQREVPWHHGQ